MLPHRSFDPVFDHGRTRDAGDISPEHRTFLFDGWSYRAIPADNTAPREAIDRQPDGETPVTA